MYKTGGGKSKDTAAHFAAMRAFEVEPRRTIPAVAVVGRGGRPIPSEARPAIMSPYAGSSRRRRRPLAGTFLEQSMRPKLLFGVGMIVMSGLPVSASPISNAQTVSALVADAPVVSIHHKPGHRGGPPWTRGYDRDWRQERGDWRYERGDWRYDRAPATVTVCRTVPRTEFDPYAGLYVRRPVRICRERYEY
jgi:hypothetical protein